MLFRSPVLPSGAILFWRAIFACLWLLAPVACVSPDAAHATKEPASAGAGQYLIQPGDVLTVTFATDSSYNQQTRVDWDGKVNLPFLSQNGRFEMKAAGLSAAELSEKITQTARSNSILVNAAAQVMVTEYATQSFVLLGQVAQPGRYQFPRGLPPRLPVSEAIGMGGGYTRLARQSRVLVKRGDQVFTLDLRKMTTHSGEADFIVKPGDIVTVAERIF